MGGKDHFFMKVSIHNDNNSKQKKDRQSDSLVCHTNIRSFKKVLGEHCKYFDFNPKEGGEVGVLCARSSGDRLPFLAGSY